MPLNKRVEILFDENEYRELERNAKARKTSVGSLVREAVAKYVTGEDRERRRRALTWLTSQNFGDFGTPEELSKEMSDSMYRAIVKGLGPDHPWAKELEENE
jgi:predicted transcriptional regulator